MISRRLPTAIFTLFLLFSAANAQRAELTLNLNEAFFDALLDSVFQDLGPLDFPIAKAETRTDVVSTIPASFSTVKNVNNICNESVRILREINGVRTAVRFREGKVYVPLAFTGNYSPPLVGCVEFAGWAETNIDLEFDQAGQRVIGRARVLNVNLNGTGGIGGTVIARMIQSSIDKKFNPLEIVNLEKLSFALPVRGKGNIRARAVSARPEIINSQLNLHITYAFEKG